MGKNVLFFFFLRSHVAQAGFQLAIENRMTLNFWSVHLDLSSTMITDVCQHIPQVWGANPSVCPALGINPRALSTVGQHSVLWAVAPVQECNLLEGTVHLMTVNSTEGFITGKWRKGRECLQDTHSTLAQRQLQLSPYLNRNTEQGFLKAMTGLKRWLRG